MAYASFGLVLQGACRLAVIGQEPVRLSAGDFVLMPANAGFTMTSDLEGETIALDPQGDAVCRDGDIWYGDPRQEADFKQLGGYFKLAAVNRNLLGSLLPSLVHIQASEPAAGRLKRTIDLLLEEALADRPGRDLVFNRLIEVLLVEALRYGNRYADAISQPGLVAGLTDPHLARALRRLHRDVARAWSVEDLAREAGLSRSVFSERFSHKVGRPPLRYLIDWRMALAKVMLRQDGLSLEAIAASIGYQSASAFSTAFRREVGKSPSEFARSITD